MSLSRTITSKSPFASGSLSTYNLITVTLLGSVVFLVKVADSEVVGRTYPSGTLVTLAV